MLLSTSISQADEAIEQLRSQSWRNVGTQARIDYLKRCLQGVMLVAEPWAIAAGEAKSSDAIGEEWLTGAVTTLMNLRSLIRTLEGRTCSHAPKATAKISNGIAQVFPNDLLDRLLWLGFRGEVWLDPNQVIEEQRPGIALVLGAGNVGSTPPMDLLYKLFVENQVVLLKMNPVNEYVGTFLEQAFESLIRDGFLQIVYGGSDLGRYLCQHPKVDSVHITGSDRTHDAIVWGGDQRIQPILQKPITSELGCVTPVLVVPGDWSESDLAFQARHIASMVTHNASFNCVAAKLLVTAKGWKLRDRLLNLIRQEFAKIPLRKAYYPGAQERYQGFLDRYPQAEVFGTRTEEIVPWTLIPNVKDEYALQTEAFCGVLAEVRLDANSEAEFLDRAVPFVNDQVWGNLSCVVLTKTKIDHIIANLNYGAIGINVWTGVIYALPDFAWGAFPGNQLSDIRSGRGFVHNAYFLDRPQKSVLYAPFRIRPTPFWFADHRNLLNFAQRAAELQLTPTWRKFSQVIIAALQG